MQTLKKILSSLLILAMLVYGTPASARFMGVDPQAPDAANPHSFNRYAYGNNNPYRYVDPDGRFSIDWFNLGGFFNNPFAQASVAAPGNGTNEFLKTSVDNVAHDVEEIGKDVAITVGVELATAGAATAVPALIRATKLGQTASEGLAANPFKGKTFAEIDKILTKKGFSKVGPDAASGKGAYFHPESGRKYYLDKGGTYREGTELPHVDVHRMKDGVNLEGSKRRYPLGEKLIEPNP